MGLCLLASPRLRGVLMPKFEIEIKTEITNFYKIVVIAEDKADLQELAFEKLFSGKFDPYVSSVESDEIVNIKEIS